MKHLQKIFLVIITASLFNVCNTTEPPGNQTLTLKLEDVSCTEAWIQLTTNNLQLPTTINILKNNTVAQTFSLSTQDTLLYIDSLLPNQTYKFKVVLTNNPQPTSYPQPPTSNEVSVTTMDTTSHNFTWQTFTFGDAGAGSSTLYDVAIIDGNNIWAVGEIYMLDSLGRPDPNAYNAIHWNGQSWELKRIMFYTICGQQSRSSYPAKSIFAFNDNEIWIGMDGDQITKLENGLQVITTCLPWSFSINKLWGSNSNDLYTVGSNGNIAHYQNGSWTKIESGTNLEIQDVLGESNLENLQQEVFCIASDKYQQIDKKVYKIMNNNITEISTEGLPWSLSSIWFKSKYKCYIVGDGIFMKNLSNAGYWRDITQGITPYYTHLIRGTGLNDVVVGGSFGELLHFNGSTWYSYKGRELPEFIGNYFSVGIKGNTVCAVGQATINSNVAIISLGIK